MSNLLTDSNNCCGTPSCCETAEVQNIPGPQGPAGADCTPCDDGVNAFTSTTANFTQPAVDANVSVEVVDSTWIVIGQELFIETGGYYLAVSKADSTHVTVKNRGYTGAAAPAAIIASGAHVGPAGLVGTAGSAPAGVLLAANNLSDVNNVATSRTSLGLGTMATQTATDYLAKAGNLAGLANVTTAQQNLNLELAVDVQPFSNILDSLTDLSPTGTDYMPYFSAPDSFTETPLTAYARTLLDDATAVNARVTLGGVLPRYGCLGYRQNVDMNVGNTDTIIGIESVRYRIDKITVTRATLNLTTATAGAFTAAAAGGTAIANDQVLTALTAQAKFKDLTLQAVTGTDVFTGANVYFRVGTPQGAGSTADVYIYGWDMS